MTTGLDRQDRWDVGFAVALCLVPLLAWQSTFLGSGWWLVALLGIGAGVAVTAGVIVAGGGLDKALAAVLATYAVLCGPVANGGLGDGMLQAGLTGTGRGWVLLTGTHPWLDGSGQVLLPVLQLCLLGSALVVGLAMHSRSPSLPLLPAVVLLGAALFTGRAEPASVLVLGLVFGVVAVVWARQRSRLVEGTPVVGGGVMDHAATLLPAVGVLLVAALVAVVATRAVDVDQRVVMRSLVPAYDVSSLSTPLDEFTTFAKQTDPAPGNVFTSALLGVQGAPEGTRLRFATLDTYDGERWAPGNDTDPGRADDRYLRIGPRIDNPAPGERLQVGIAPLEDWVGPWIPTPGSVERLGFIPGAQPGMQRRVRYNPATRTAVNAGNGLTESDIYTVTTRVHDPEVTEQMVPSDEVDEQLYEAAAFLDPAVEAWSAGATSSVDAVLRVAAALKQAGRYSGDDGARYGPGHGERRLGAGFVLEDPTVGNDEQYAAAMALMANRLRIPARVVVGAEVPENGVVRGRHVSAWVELRAADGTWHVLDTDTFMGRRPPPDEPEGGGGDQSGGHAERIFPEQSPGEEQQPEEHREQPEREQPEPGEEGESAADPADGRDIPWWPLLALLALVLVAPLGAVPLLKWWRRRRRLRAERVADRYVGAWAELVDHARDLGHRLPPGLTRPAAARHLDADRFAPLAERADLRVFGVDDPDPADAAEFWELVQAELSDLDRGVAPWRRLWARINPASLLR